MRTFTKQDILLQTNVLETIQIFSKIINNKFGYIKQKHPWNETAFQLINLQYPDF